MDFMSCGHLLAGRFLPPSSDRSISCSGRSIDEMESRLLQVDESLTKSHPIVPHLWHPGKETVHARHSGPAIRSVTQITVIEAEPEQQQEALSLMDRAGRISWSRQPGFHLDQPAPKPRRTAAS